MAYKNIYGLKGTITQPMPASVSATTVQLSGTTAAMVQAVLSAGDWTYLLVDTGAYSEVIKLYHSTTVDFTVERAQEDSAAVAHAIGSQVEFVLTAAAVAPLVTPEAPSVSSFGIINAHYDSPTELVIEANEPSFDGYGISISGSWSSGYSFSLTEDDTGCCGGSGGGSSSGISSLYGNGIADVQQSGTTATITVEEPTFEGEDGISISGSWPNYTFSGSGSSGAGTVTVVTAGTGVSITGTPSVAPVVGLGASGVMAGSYGALTVDVYGRLTAVDTDFNPPSTITATPPLTATRTGNALALAVGAGAEGTTGVLALADADDPLDAADRTTAVSPALLASVVEALAGTTVSGTSAYSPAASALYTNVVTAVPVPIDLAAGENMLVLMHATMTITATPETPPQYGMALFNSSSVLLQGNVSITQSEQNMACLLTGPMTTGLAMVTTAVPSGASVVSSGLVVIKF